MGSWIPDIGEIEVGDELIISPIPELTPELTARVLLSLKIRVASKTNSNGQVIFRIRRGGYPPDCEISEKDLRMLAIRRCIPRNRSSNP